VVVSGEGIPLGVEGHLQVFIGVCLSLFLVLVILLIIIIAFIIIFFLLIPFVIVVIGIFD
jgi:hypothetical protein